MSEEDERQARAETRRTRMIPIRRFKLGEEPLVDDLDASTVDDRLREVFRLSVAVFRLSGRPWPSYSRASMPGRVVRRRA